MITVLPDPDLDQGPSVSEAIAQHASMTMVERVARALRAASEGANVSSLCDEFGSWAPSEDFRILARAAIEAMREVTPSMEAGVTNMLIRTSSCIDCGVEDIWHAAIDAVLSEQSA